MANQEHKPFVPPVPRDHADATFSEMVPFRSSKIKIFKSPLFLLAILAAVLAPFMFGLLDSMLSAQTVEARAGAMMTANKIAVFFIVMMFQLIVYLYLRPARAIWTYMISFTVVAAMLFFPIISLPFFYLFRVIPLGTINPEPSMNFMTMFVRMLFAAGLMEELMKAVPILFGAWLTTRAINDPRKAQSGLYKAMHVRGPLDGALMGIFAGGGFIFIETAFQYVPNITGQIYQQSNDLGTAMTAALLLLLPRVFGGLVGHMAYSGIFGYFIGLAVIRPKAKWKLLAIGYFSAALIHTLWNSVGLISPLLMYVIAFAAAIGLVGAMLKARQLEMSGSAAGTGDTMGSIVVERPIAPPVAPPAMPIPQTPPPQPSAFAPPAPQAPPPQPAPAMAAAPAAMSAEVLGLDIDGMMLPLRAGGRLDLGAEPALGGRGAGVVGSIIPHPTRPNVLGLRNEGPGPWSAKLRDGSLQTIANDQSIRLAAGVGITFADGLSGAVVKLA